MSTAKAVAAVRLAAATTPARMRAMRMDSPSVMDLPIMARGYDSPVTAALELFSVAAGRQHVDAQREEEERHDAAEHRPRNPLEQPGPHRRPDAYADNGRGHLRPLA